MAATRWTMHNYWSFVHEVQRKYAVSIPTARAVYRETRDRIGRSARKVDIRREPAAVSRAVAAARTPAPGAVIAPGAPADGGPAGPPLTIDSISRYQDLMEYFDEGELDFYEVEDSEEYE